MDSYRDEIDRIRSIYAGRKEKGLPERYLPYLPYNRYAFQEREATFVDLLRSEGFKSLAGMDIFDLGCGGGGALLHLPGYGAEPQRLFGGDLRIDSLAEARRNSSQLNLLCANAAQLPFQDCTFHLVLQSTVFTSVLSNEIRQFIAKEMLRVLRPDGWVVWYDFAIDNPRNRNVRGVSLSEIKSLFMGCRIRWRRVTLAPPIGRLISPLSPFVYRMLSGLKLMNTHYLCLIHKA